MISSDAGPGRPRGHWAAPQVGYSIFEGAAAVADRYDYALAAAGQEKALFPRKLERARA